MTTQFNNGQILDAAATEALLKGKPFMMSNDGTADFNPSPAEPTSSSTAAANGAAGTSAKPYSKPAAGSRKINLNLSGEILAAAIRASASGGYGTISAFITALLEKELGSTIGKPRIGSTTQGRTKVTRATNIGNAISLPTEAYE